MQLLWLDFTASWIHVMVFLATYFLISLLFAKDMAHKSAVKSQEWKKNSSTIFYSRSDSYHFSATHTYQDYFIAFFEY